LSGADANPRDSFSRPSADAEGHPLPPSGFANATPDKGGEGGVAAGRLPLSLTLPRNPPPPSATAGQEGGGEEPVAEGGEERAVDWGEVRRLYELGSESVASIQRRFGLTAYQLRRVREGEDWTKREPVIKPGPLQGHKAVGVDSLELKLNKLVAIGIAMLEQKVADEGMTETNARTLKELARAQETRMRSTRNEKAAKAREKKNNDAGYDFRDDPAWLDAEIDRRIERLARVVEASKTQGEAAGGEAEVSGGLA